MFQVVVSYLESRFACFFTDEPISIYEDLLDKIKEVVPYIRNIPSQRIRVAYKDINLSTARESDEGIFINISPGDSLILNEAFRNAYDCGSESFKRVHVKVREIDSPFIAKNRREIKEGSNVEQATSSEEPRATTHVEHSSRKKLGFQNVSTKPILVEDWKKDKEKDITAQLEEKQNELFAVKAQLEEMNRPVLEPPQSGQYRSIVCGNCHVRGHRSDGNKNNAPCLKEPCYSYISCGQNKKHPEHFEEIRGLKKRCKQLTSEIDILNKDRQNVVLFESKSISAFTTAITNRLMKAFPDRYDPRTAVGKIKLQKDIVTIRLACNGKIPNFTTVTDDRNIFLDLLEEQQSRFDKIDNLDKRECYEKPSTSTYISTNNSPHFTNINKLSSPVKVKKSKKNRQRRRKYSSSSSSSESDSDSMSSSSTSGDQMHGYKSKRKHSHTGKKKRKYRKKRRNNLLSKLVEGAVPSNSNVQSEKTVHVITTDDDHSDITETKSDKNNDIDLVSAPSSGICSLECLASVAENFANLQTP